MVLGVGKTSLIRSLFGKRFSLNQKFTRGIENQSISTLINPTQEPTLSFENRCINSSDWAIISEDDKIKHDSQSFIKGLVSVIKEEKPELLKDIDKCSVEAQSGLNYMELNEDELLKEIEKQPLLIISQQEKKVRFDEGTHGSDDNDVASMKGAFTIKQPSEPQPQAHQSKNPPSRQSQPPSSLSSSLSSTSHSSPLSSLHPSSPNHSSPSSALARVSIGRGNVKIVFKKSDLHCKEEW